MSSERRLLRTKPAAAYLSLSAWKLRSLVTGGELPFVQADASSPWLFDVRDLDKWADEHKRRAKPGLANANRRRHTRLRYKRNYPLITSPEIPQLIRVRKLQKSINRLAKGRKK